MPAPKTITRKTRRSRWLGFAAACLLLVCGAFGGGYYYTNLAVDSIVDIDVNPGIELTTNRQDMVLDVTAVNEDAGRVLDGMDLKNTQLKVAVNAIIGSMVRTGYLTGDGSSILVTVRNDDAQRAQQVRNLVVSDIDASLKTNNITASVVNQTVSESSAAETLAGQQGISFGKAVLILNLCAKDDTLDPAALAQMSLREIAALTAQRNIDIRDIVDYDADDSVWENIEDAVEEVNEDGYRPQTGSAAQTTPAAPAQTSAALTAAQAKQIALDHAGIAETDAVFVKAELDYDDGRTVYEIEFLAGRMEYDYEIDAATGAVLQAETERDD